MRRSLIAAVLGFALCALPLAAFEIESETTFAVSAPTGTLRILSTTDTSLFAPVVRAFQTANPTTEVFYVSASSTEVMVAIETESAEFDLVVSSAMDLQTKLANDGFAQPFRSAATDIVPDWAKWRDSVFGFTQEPATLVLSVAAFEGLAMPLTRQDLIATLRANPERFQDQIGTYDVRASGLGYLFATQDSRTSESYWRLAEVMGALGTRLYCCSSDMIDDVSSGEIAVAYNVLGSYAAARQDIADKIHVIEPSDFTSTMQRTVLMLRQAENQTAAGKFINHLLETAWGKDSDALAAFHDFPRVIGDPANRKPIRLGPGLLVFLDRFKREKFRQAWEDAFVQ